MAEIWYYKKLRDYERKVRGQAKEISDLKRRLKEEEEKRRAAEDELRNFAMRKQSRKPKFPDYSLGRQEKLQNAIFFKSPGRTPREKKNRKADRTEDVFPEGVPPWRCVQVSSRLVTHLRDGKMEAVLYRIYRKNWGKARGKLPHVMPKGEYGVEVAVSLAFLVYSLGLSHAQAIQVLSFFCGLEINESEADSLLSQISRLWEKEFESLCDLLLLSSLVHIDETGWKVGAENCFAWIFKTLSHTVLLYGEKRNEEVLDKMLPRGIYKGIGITDCYRIYEKYFGTAQKCWAHFLRKIIKLKLLYPQKREYAVFFESLFALFRDAREIKKDETLTPEQKTMKVKVFTERIRTLCAEAEVRMDKNTIPDRKDYINLQKNLIRNIDDLFTFVLHEGVEPTNNRAEQGFRFTARARNNYQTSKTEKGAKRRTVIASVLASLRQNLPDFSLKTITEESVRWLREGKSLFEIQMERLRQPQGASP